jgi:ornithine decarboxylase
MTTVRAGDALIQLAQGHFADTPALIIDTASLKQTIATFASYAPAITAYYAVKANAELEILQIIASQGLGFEVASTAELAALLSMGVASDRIITSNPIKAPAFIDAMLESGANRFVVDSIDEIDKLAARAPGCRVLLRLAVDNTGSTWPLHEKFAATATETVQLALHAVDVGLLPVGITFHVGSQSTNPYAWNTALRDAKFVWDDVQTHGIYFNTLNLGGGFPAAHDNLCPDHRRSLDAIMEAVVDFPDATTVEVEPGRGLVGDAGVLVTRIVGLATRSGARWVYLDVGVYNGLMETTGGIEYEYNSLDRGGHEQSWTVAGPSCDSTDIMARDVQLPATLAVNDRIAISPAGAYTTVYASAFNGLPHPRVICL